MNSNDVRKSFLDFFESKGHKIVPSAPVVPLDDPTLLFANAGMNQFKNAFLGLEKAPWPRIADTQKCIRVSGKHNDLEDVGWDTYHHTFFEMLGNWSFGDYYKREAIQWAWELLTAVWKLPKERLWATVFEEDDEAERLWYEVTDLLPGRVLRFGAKDNFWEMGEVGPCGPCSEIHIDRGEGYCDKPKVPGHTCGVNQGCARFIELWNLVFIQYNREHDGSLIELPAKHVDTGMGFERVVAVLQGEASNYDTDLFTPILGEIERLTGVKYPRRGALDKTTQDIGAGPEGGVAHRVIADHLRALTFAICDGALPSNEGRGYVLRRLLRRAARFGRQLGMHEPFLHRLVPVLTEVMGPAFPELKEGGPFASMVIRSEEESFNATLDRGLEIFESMTRELEKRGEKQIPGEEAFRLYDTYGFPLDLTQLMAREKGFTVEEEGFHRAMEAQRQRARQAGKWEYTVEFNFDEWDTLTEGTDSEFLGYHTLDADAEIRKLKRQGDRVYLVLSRTPFYAEAGGQIGDRGVLEGENFRIEIEDTIRVAGKILHIGRMEAGAEIKSPKVRATVYRDIRRSTMRNHTGTHLLHKALKEVLGPHANQAGSLVAPDRLRFDVTHFQPITPEQLEEIERRVNEKIRENIPVEVFWTSYSEARRLGAVALFGEKYGDQVRVIKIGDYSMELCGGTHLQATGEIGYFRIVSESSVAAGVRRIEAVTGLYATELLLKENRVLEQVKTLLGVPQEEIPAKLSQLMEEKKSLERELKKFKLRISRGEIARLVEQSKVLDGFRIVTSKVETVDVEELKRIGDALRERLGSGVGVLGTVIDDKVSFVCVVTDDLIKKKHLKAGEIVRRVAEIAGGSGGGRSHMALAGAKDARKIGTALGKVEDIVKELLQRK